MARFREKFLHYDLDFLSPGQKWRSSSDSARFENYEFAREQFELTPEDQVKQILPDGLLYLKDYGDFAENTKLLGYPRLLTLKTVDMVIGQPPIISAQADDAKSERIKEIRSECALNANLKQALIDYSRFGIFLVRIFRSKKGRARLTVWDPREWYPVFKSDGTNQISHNVIGWKHKGTLTLQIHDAEDGSYEERICNIDDDGVIGKIVSSNKYNMTSGKKLLFAVVNTPTSTNPLGTSDYEIVNAPLQKAIERLRAILRVLDEHANPSMKGPHSLLSRSESGETVFKTSKYYAIGSDEQAPEYIVWQAELESSFKAFSELCNQIYVLSEMGEAFLGASGGSGNVVSGTAMRFKMISPLEKARRVANEISEPLKEIVSTLLSIEDVELSPLDINIAWRDNLPKDPREVAELSRLESGAPAVKPLTSSLMDNYDLDKESADLYRKRILEEQPLFNLKNNDPVNPQDGRSHGVSGSVDTRKQGSMMNPASSENRGEDSSK